MMTGQTGAVSVGMCLQLMLYMYESNCMLQNVRFRCEVVF